MLHDAGPFATRNPWRMIGWSVAGGLILGTLLIGFVILPIANRSPVEPIWTAICTALGLQPASSLAGPAPTPRYASLVQWSYGEIRAANDGDPHKGTFVALNCGACHGDSGISEASWIPSLAGMLPEVTVKQLADFRTGHRSFPVMNAIATALSADQVRDVAAYYAGLKPAAEIVRPGLLAGNRGPRSSDPIIRLVYAGDPSRGIAPCASCHGIDGQKLAAPVLAGQHKAYIEQQLAGFRSGTRRNDEGEQMRVVAAKLTDTEINGLASFLSSGKQ